MVQQNKEISDEESSELVEDKQDLSISPTSIIQNYSQDKETITDATEDATETRKFDDDVELVLGDDLEAKNKN